VAKHIQAVRGMHDILPPDSERWAAVEAVARELLEGYGYREIRLPLVERTELFRRSIGEVTDIVEKEMYTFEDRSGDLLSLRPEGTAGCVRAGIEHGLLFNQQQRLWYAGPMFRHERPQKGRYRQFHQIGVETFGMEGPDIEAELIHLSARLWQRLGVTGIELELNSLGTPAERRVYRQALVEYFFEHYESLDEDSRRRLEHNPLRILDTKNPEMQALVEAAPRLLDHLGEGSRARFDELQELLADRGVSFRVNPRLVRGLDYYCHTVFEWTTRRLGAQGTVCAGGRYDGLVEQLGGRPTPAAGFALGMERLIALVEEDDPGWRPPAPHGYLVMVGAGARRAGMLLAERLRSAIPGLRLVCNCGGGSFKSQLKRADRSGAALALILGEDEAAAGTIAIKDLRGTHEQRTVAQADLAAELEALREAGVLQD